MTYRVIIIILIISATISFTISEKMHKSTKGGSPNIISEYLGVAITNMQYGHTGYVGYKDVRNLIKDEGSIDNSVIDKAMAIDLPSANDSYIIVGIDVGYVDYCRLAFYLFGTRVNSLLYLYLSIFIISIVLFFIVFRKSVFANVILVLFLLAHYVTITAIPYLDYNVGVIYNPRLIPMLGVLPLIHIFLSIRQNNSIYGFIFILIQSFIIIMVYHIRSDALWIILFMCCYLILNVSTFLYRSYRETPELDLKNKLRNNFKKILFDRSWKLTPVLIMFLVYKIMFPFALDSKYSERGEGIHKFWISTFLGLAMHPEIREYYVGERTLKLKEKSDIMCAEEAFQRVKNLKPEVRKWLCNNKIILHKLLKLQNYFLYEAMDNDGFSASFNWLHQKGMSEYELFYFSPEDSVNYNNSFTFFNSNNSEGITSSSEIRMKNFRNFDDTEDFNWGKYETISYNVSLDVVHTHPLQVLETLFFIKPLQYSFMYFFSFFPRILDFLAIAMLCFVIFLIYVEKSISKDEIWRGLIFFLIILLFSVSPYMITYPGRHVMFSQVILIHMIEFILLIILFGYIFSKYITKYTDKSFFRQGGG